MGEQIDCNAFDEPSGFYAYYAIHSYKDGILEQICIDPVVEKSNIVEKHIIKQMGDEIKAFTGANTTLGILLMKFESMVQMLQMIDHSEEWIQVQLKG